MRHAVFFDLETSDVNFVGQILNYSFIHVDENWNIVSELSGDIRLNRLQLPSPYAIMANKIDILEHQKIVQDTEPDAFTKIRSYLEHISEWHSGAALIGFNSTKFDVPFLRTSMIRNGFNPYFGKNLLYKDLLYLARKLATYHKDFCEDVGVNKISDDFTPSLKLQNLCNIFTQHKGVQSHNSREDVIWTIDLAKVFAERFEEDIREFDCYEPPQFHRGIFQNVWVKTYPNWSNTHGEEEEDGETAKPDKQPVYNSPMICLEDDGRNQALWVDVNLFLQGKRREAVFWYNKSTSPFFVSQILEQKDVNYIIDDIRGALKDVTLENYFTPKNCDVEQYIYSLKFQENDAIAYAIRGNPKLLQQIQSKRAEIVYMRYIAAYHNSAISDTLFKKYVFYRYGGKLKLSKNDFETQYQEGVKSDLFHQTYNEYFDQIEEIRKTNISSTDAALLDSLEQYLKTCEIGTQFGQELSQIIRK